MIDIAYEYALDIHNIPSEYIEHIDIYIYIESTRIEISLVDNKKFFSEDWYQLLLQYGSA